MSQIKDLFLANFQRTAALIMHQSMRSMWTFTKNHGMSISQMVALRHIYYSHVCNISDISGELGITNAASSQLLDRLVQLDLISRNENPQDRRNKSLVITEKGKQMLQDSAHERQLWLTRLADSLSEDEQARVSEALQILIDKNLLLEG